MEWEILQWIYFHLIESLIEKFVLWIYFYTVYSVSVRILMMVADTGGKGSLNTMALFSRHQFFGENIGENCKWFKVECSSL